MQNAALNGGHIIVHGTGSFNAHLASAYKRWDNAKHLMCDGCDNLAEEGAYDIIPVEVPQPLLALLDTNVRIQAALRVTRRLYLDAVTRGDTGVPLLTILYALENGVEDTAITKDDTGWEAFVRDRRFEAELVIADRKRKALENLRKASESPE